VFIDAHVHVVAFSIHEEFRRLGLSAIFDHCPAHEIKEATDSLLSDMEKAGVESSLVVTSCNLSIFEEYAKRYPDKLFIAYLFDSRNPREGLRVLRRTVEKHDRLIKCVKTMFPYLGQSPLQKEFSPLYRFCEKRKLPIQFHMGGDHNMENLSNPLYFGKLASIFPQLKIVCLHAGGGMMATVPLLMKLWPNIYLEVEGLQLNEAEGSREPNALRFLLEHVGSNRLMFGSDRIFPEEKYFWRVHAVKSVASEHLENLCWKTANHVFDLGLDRKRRKYEAPAEMGVSKRQKPPKSRTAGRKK